MQRIALIAPGALSLALPELKDDGFGSREESLWHQERSA
jgi:hypothetical protein